MLLILLLCPSNELKSHFLFKLMHENELRRTRAKRRCEIDKNGFVKSGCLYWGTVNFSPFDVVSREELTRGNFHTIILSYTTSSLVESFFIFIHYLRMSISALFAGTSRVFYVLIVFRVRNWARILVLIADWQKSDWIQCKNMVEPNSHSDYSNREHLTYNVITKPSVQFHVLRKMKQQCCKRQHSALWRYITFLSSFIFVFVFVLFILYFNLVIP